MNFLTIDIDWAHDVAIADTLCLLSEYGVLATWFVTHATPLLADIRAAGHELGLHPNFNPLLLGDGKSAKEILAPLKALLPDAVSVRSHSLVRSSRLSVLFSEIGLTHESNVFIPPSAGDGPNIWRDPSGLVQLPLRWADDVRLIDPSVGEPASMIDTLFPCVVDFHPVHIYINSCDPLDYEAARSDMQNPKHLLSLRRPNHSGGTRDRLVKFLRTVQDLKTRSMLVRDAALGSNLAHAHFSDRTNPHTS